ncbi:hypothetical protein FN846DRAFT_773522, partial [Sphaerosporella brunnea]
LIGDSELLTLFHPEQQEFETAHWSSCFGKNDIYASYFDNLSPRAFQASGFNKFLSLQRVDREIYQQLADPIWNIHGNQPLGEIPFSRDDINTFRKFLYLMTSLGNRERNMHLLAHHEFMENARVRRRRFIENNDLEHARDVWLRNAERMLDSPHYQIPETTSIFDLDRHDYKANAVDRYMVFWQAAPGDEFVLTDSAFGGFEGGQIGAKKSSNIDMTPLELEQHLYTRDFMWHQIYVLSPTLVMALCHPTLMHPELTKQQRRRWGLRKSLLESLPHDLPHRYYKDMKKSELSFSKEGWQIPVEVDKYFAPENARGHDRRRDEDVVFSIHSLSSSQVAMVNSVLLHNQELGPKIQSVCVRPPQSYQCFHQSLRQFQLDPWPKYSEEVQNIYEPLLRRLEEYLHQTLPPTPPNVPSNYPYQQLPSRQMFERPTFSDIQYSALSMSDVPRYDEHSEQGRPPHLQAHSSTQSTLTAPSSQSSYSFSSASSQSSTSTKTTSIDTPRFEPKHFEQQQRKRSPTLSNQERSSSDGSVRRSNTSGKSQRAKAGKNKGYNLVIEKALQEAKAIEALQGVSTGYLSAYGHDQLHMTGLNGYQETPARGRNPATTRPRPHSNPSSKRTSPIPTNIENGRAAVSENTGIPQKNYSSEKARSSLPHRAQTEPQQFPPVQVRANGYVHQNGQYVSEMQPSQRRSNRSPERQYVPDLPLPPVRRVNQSPEHRELPQPQLQPQQQYRPPTKRGITTSDSTRYEAVDQDAPAPRGPERAPDQEVPLVDARGRRYEPIKAEQTQTQHNGSLPPTRTRSHSIRMDPSPVNHPQPLQERSAQQQQMIDGTANGNIYQMVAPSQPPTRGMATTAMQAQPQPQPTSPQVPAQQQPTPSPVPQHQPQPQPTQQQQPPSQPQQQPSQSSSRNGSATTEHPTRPGVEIVRGRSLNGSQTSSQPQKVELEPSNMLALTYPGHEPAPVVKQLRFETPVKQLSHRLSDLSLTGSMLVHVGDTPSRLESEYDEDSDDDGASWEDEGYVEADEVVPTKKVVRFADKPLPSPKPIPLLPRFGLSTGTSLFEKAALFRKGMEIERPNSRQGRRVEIPRPLSRNGQRFEHRKHLTATPTRRA